MKHFLLNNNVYSKSELLDFAHKQINVTHLTWQQELYQFILEWLSDSSTIDIYTSGSTGTPKKIQHLKSDMRLSAQRTINYFGLTEGDNLLLCLPVKYIAGMMMVVRAFEGNMNLVCLPPEELIESLNENSRFDFAALVPLQMGQIIEKKQLHLFKKIILGGAPLTDSIREKIIRDFDGIAYETYGMTETITHVAVKEISSFSGGFFHALAGITFSIDNRDCLIIQDSLYNRTFTTNDRVELKDAHTFQLLGRIDNVINSGGIKVQPEEIEQVLSPFIKKKFLYHWNPRFKAGNQNCSGYRKRRGFRAD